VALIIVFTLNQSGSDGPSTSPGLPNPFGNVIHHSPHTVHQTKRRIIHHTEDVIMLSTV
jgi:hypothetical protein